VEAAAQQLARSEVVVAEAQRREAVRAVAERELSDALPGFFSKADPERLRSAIGAARRGGVAECAVLSAEATLRRGEAREEEQARKAAARDEQALARRAALDSRRKAEGRSRRAAEAAAAEAAAKHQRGEAAADNLPDDLPDDLPRGRNLMLRGGGASPGQATAWPVVLYDSKTAAEAQAAALVRAGLAANDRGAPDFARAKFVAAYRISSRPSTLVSAANMALKMGDAATAVREYEKVLHASGELTPALAAAAEQKMSEARAALEHSALAREYAAGPQSSPQKALHFSEHSSPQQLGRPYMGSGRIEESSPGGREDPNALGPVSDRGQLWWHLRARLAAALLKAARVLLVCGVLALAAAALHVAWLSRGDTLSAW